MQLKYRLPLSFSIAISVLLAVATAVVYYFFADFRQTDYRERLYQKAQTTGRLLIEVKEVDSTLLSIIDKASTDKLFEESIQIYDDGMKLLYLSGSEPPIALRNQDLRTLKREGQVFWKKEKEFFGLHSVYGNQSYYVFISAVDKFGIRKLNYLKILLLIVYVITVAMVWAMSFYLSKLALRSLLRVTKQIQDIDRGNRKIDLKELRQQDEIRALATSFNTMMERIEDAYKSQQEFASNAAHELRTPVARITVQLENLVKQNTFKPGIHDRLQSIQHDVYSLADTITSLLLLSKIEAAPEQPSFEKVRIDEVLFAARAQLIKSYPDFTFQFTIENETANETSVDVYGDETLLVIAFANILRNAYEYSDDQVVRCLLRQTDSQLQVCVVNHGNTPAIEDTRQLLATFKRGSNSQGKAGSGIGLSIVQRILQHHNAALFYNLPNRRTNEIIVVFPLSLHLPGTKV